jgi:hypothetical protein
VKRLVLLLSLCVALLVAGNTLAQTAAQATRSDPLADLNVLFLKEYAARIDVINQEHPLYIEVSGNDLVLHRNGKEESKRVIPETFHRLKEVSHVPVLLYLRLEPLSSLPQLSESDIAGLKTLSAEISAARNALSASGLDDSQRPIIDHSLMLLRKTIEVKHLSRTTLDDFAHTMGPLLLANANTAACYAIQGMHAQMMQWKRVMTENEWARIVVINPGVMQPRYRSLATQYFGWLFSAPAPPWAYPGENERVVYSEFQLPHRNSPELLASLQIDRDAATAFFGNEWGLNQDLLSDGAAKCIAKLPEGDRLWHQ